MFHKEQARSSNHVLLRSCNHLSVGNPKDPEVPLSAEAKALLEQRRLVEVEWEDAKGRERKGKMPMAEVARRVRTLLRQKFSLQLYRHMVKKAKTAHASKLKAVCHVLGVPFYRMLPLDKEQLAWLEYLDRIRAADPSAVAFATETLRRQTEGAEAEAARIRGELDGKESAEDDDRHPPLRPLRPIPIRHHDR